MPRLDADTGVGEGLEPGQRLRKELGLHLLGDLEFLGGAAFGFEFFVESLALRFDLPAQYIGGEQLVGVAVDVGKDG